MWASIFKTCAATAIFAAAHSGLASRKAKAAASALLGPSNANGVYRALFIAQSVMTTGLLVAYIRRQPSVGIYRIRGPLAWAMHAGQMAGLLHATAAAHQVGILRITGLANFQAWLKGEQVPTMPEAQGPALNSNSVARAAGPFAWSRHPLNLSPVPVLWLWPRMTTTLLAFNVASTFYLIVGSLHEEQRLSDVDGAKYETYRTSGVPFFWPTRVRGPSRELVKLLNSSSTDAS